MPEDYKQVVRDRVLDAEHFARAVFSGQQHGREVPWRRVVLRPVLIKGQRHIQFSYLDARRDITRNYAGDEAAQKLEDLLASAFRNIHVQTTDQHVQIQITKKGKALIHHHKAKEPARLPSLEHDRRKDLLLPVGEPDPFLVMIGVMTQEGRVRPRMRSKFRQINEFLRLVIEAGAAELEGTPLSVVDCGCGNAYLTFALYHYFNDVLHRPTRLTGIDVNQQLIDRRTRQSRELGWPDLDFQRTRILDFHPPVLPDIVVALHACDTATDEALAQAVRWQCKMLFAAPCCHHHVQQQLAQRGPPSPLEPVFRHGILRERLGDVLTDTLRSLILRIAGYRTEVVQFVSPEHTDKNLMIRAVRSGHPGHPQTVQQYRGLKQYFGITPFLEQLLSDELSEWL